MTRRKKIFPNLRLGKYKKSKLLGVYGSISGYLMIALGWWYIAFPEMRALSLTFLLMYFLGVLTWIGHYLDILGIKTFPGRILPPGNYKQIKEIIAVSIASIIGIVYIFPKFLLELPTLAAFNISLLNPIYVLVIWGWIIPFTEEKLFGGALHPSLIGTFDELKISRTTSILLGTLAVSGIFAMYNQYVFAIPFAVLSYYFIIRAFFSIMNLHYGSMTFGLFTHMGINSYLVCQLFNLPLWQAVLPVGLTMFAFWYLPPRSRFV